jgi:hypothetical protein
MCEDRWCLLTTFMGSNWRYCSVPVLHMTQQRCDGGFWGAGEKGVVGGGAACGGVGGACVGKVGAGAVFEECLVLGRRQE